MQARTWLDTDIGDGEHFFETEDAWLLGADSARTLHYVGLTEAQLLPPRLQQLLQTERGVLTPGFHRFYLRQGRVSFTLCVGDAHAMLTELRMQADAVIGPRVPELWSRWTWKLLAKQCRRHATLHLRQLPAAGDSAPLREAGFVAPLDAVHPWVFDPRWALTRPQGREPAAPTPARPHCAIVGAGLAGAAVAHALALRGWQVTVLDQHAHAAAGASGLPAGLAVAHVSKDDNPRSRLTRAGIALLHQHARRLLVPGSDWSPGGVLELAPGKGQWHPQGCWVRPARLVQAWLHHPAIAFMGDSKVHAATFEGACWSLRDAQGNLLATAPHLVLANAAALRDLALSPAPDAGLAAGLRAIRGVMSIGDWPRMQDEPQPPQFPVNGGGSFLPGIPGPHGLQWHCGATFETDGDIATEVARGHAANQTRLEKLLPQVAQALAPQWRSPHLQAWGGERCTTHDRLPLVGALQAGASAQAPGLWCSVGMGSRGLSLAALCAELLAAQMLGEPLPIEARLQTCLRPDRFRRLTPS